MLLAIEQLHGAGSVEAVKAALPEWIRAELEPSVMPVNWYPVEVCAELHVAMRDVLGKGKCILRVHTEEFVESAKR